MGVLEFITDDEQAYAIALRLVQALPAGGYLALHHGTNIVHCEASDQVVAAWNTSCNTPLVARSTAQIAQFFTGLDLLEPGIVSVSRWRPEATPWGQPHQVDAFGAVGRKP
jgi:S-adenosyl methyltransferase